MNTALLNVLLFAWLFGLARTEFKCHHKIDMVLLLDSSASIPEDVFVTTKKFAADLIEHFDISKDKANIAVLSYSQYVHMHRRFNDDASQESVLKAINEASYEGSFSRLDSALDNVYNKIFNKEHGARSSKDVKKVVVVLTDGFSSLGIEFTKKLANNLKRTGVKFFTVGTSGRIYHGEMNELASEPNKQHELFRDLAKGPFTKDEVQKFAKEICKKE